MASEIFTSSIPFHDLNDARYKCEIWSFSSLIMTVLNDFDTQSMTLFTMLYIRPWDKQ